MKNDSEISGGLTTLCIEVGDVRCYGVSDCEELVEAVTRGWWRWRQLLILILLMILLSIPFLPPKLPPNDRIRGHW